MTNEMVSGRKITKPRNVTWLDSGVREYDDGGAMFSRRSSTFKERSNASQVWQHFDKVAGTTRATCKVCGISLSYKSTTANLKGHLVRKHNFLLDAQFSSNTNSVQLLKDRDGMVREIKLESESERRRRRKSVVWRWFIELRDVTKAVCRVCKNSYSYRSFSNLTGHLKACHPSHYKQLKVLKSQAGDNLDFEISDKTYKDVTEVTGLTGGADVTESCDCPSLNGVTEHKTGCSLVQVACFWDYFEKIEQETAVCRVCSTTVSWAEDVDELRKHLETEHPELPVDKETEETPQQTHQVLLQEVPQFDSDDDEEEPVVKKRKFSSTRRHNHRQRREIFTEHDDSKENIDSLDRFGLYAASLLRYLPKHIAAKFQLQIIERLMQEKMKYCD